MTEKANQNHETNTRPSIETEVLARIAQQPDAIASKRRIAALQSLSPEEREARAAAIIAKVKARMATVTAQ